MPGKLGVAISFCVSALVAVVASVVAFPAFADSLMASSTVEIIRGSDGHLGAGVQIRSGMVITAAHVVSTEHTVIVKDDRGREQTGTVVALDTKDDLAFVSLATSMNLAISPLSCGMPQIGLAVVMIGHPFGHEFVSMQGHIMTGLKSVDPWPNLVLIDRRAFPGMSGGPVIDSNGSVVAMVVAAMGPGDQPTGPAGAVPDNVICQVLAKL